MVKVCPRWMLAAWRRRATTTSIQRSRASGLRSEPEHAASKRRAIAIGTGTDVAVETADVVLMRSEPLDVATAITTSRGTVRKMHQNLWWAVGYNRLALPIAAADRRPRPSRSRKARRASASTSPKAPGMRSAASRRRSTPCSTRKSGRQLASASSSTTPATNSRRRPRSLPRSRSRCASPALRTITSRRSGGCRAAARAGARQRGRQRRRIRLG